MTTSPLARARRPLRSATDPFVVLLVEDNPADAEIIALRLERDASAPPSFSAELIPVTSAAAACDVLRRRTVDVVILDLSLPDATGLEALHRVREAAPNVSIVVLSGMSDQALALQALRAGAQDYLLKPPPASITLQRILRYARERQRLVQERDAAVRASRVVAERWHLLAEVGKRLVKSNDLGAVTAEIAQLMVPGAADACLLYLAGDAALPMVIEIAHADGARWATLRDEVRAVLESEATTDPRIGDGQVDPDDGMGAMARAVRMVRASVGACSGAAAPIKSRGHVHGLVAFATATTRPAIANAEFTRSVAERICLAIEQAGLLRHTQRALADRDWAVGVVSHDLRNPLNTIEICADALLDPNPPSIAGVRDMGEIIQRSAAWMQQISQDLLDRTSLEAGKLTLDRQPTVVDDVMRAAQTMFEPMAHERWLSLHVETEARLPRVNGDANRLVQVLSNLLSNALKFTPPGGEVRVSAERSSEDPTNVGVTGVRFTVSDTGVGIASGDLLHVFDWFGHARRDQRTGTGLGLGIAKGLVDAHQGVLRVKSEEGHGSTFWFTVPAWDRVSYATG